MRVPLMQRFDSIRPKGALLGGSEDNNPQKIRRQGGKEHGKAVTKEQSLRPHLIIFIVGNLVK